MTISNEGGFTDSNKTAENHQLTLQFASALWSFKASRCFGSLPPHQCHFWPQQAAVFIEGTLETHWTLCVSTEAQLLTSC